jgi:hypothetical protein
VAIRLEFVSIPGVEFPLVALSHGVLQSNAGGRSKRMKFKLQKFCTFLLVLVGFCLVSGCSSPPGSDTYRLKLTGDNVDWAMTRYRNQVTYGAVTVAQQQQVSMAYDAYQKAFNEAVQQAHSNYDAPTPDNVRALANQLLSILGTIH